MTTAIEQLQEAASHALAENETAVQLLLALEELGAVTPTSLDLSALADTLPDGLEFEQYEAIGALLGRVKRSSSWWVGDFLNYGEGAYGERFAQATHATGLEEQTLLNYSYVARQVPNERRLPGVPFSVHAEVAPLAPREQKAWLKKAAEGGWSRSELRKRMKAKRAEQKPQLPGVDPEPGLIEEIARAIIRDAREHEEDASLMIVPREDIARLEAALGGE